MKIIAHLRELSAAVKCLEQPYDVVLSRLKSMKQKLKDGDSIVGFR